MTLTRSRASQRDSLAGGGQGTSAEAGLHGTIATAGKPATISAGRRFSSIAAPSLLVAAVLVAAVLRFIHLGVLPPGFNQDEAVNGYDAYSLFLTGRDHHGHPFPFAGLESFGDWASPLLTFLTAPVVGVAGLRVETVRGVAAAIGVLAVPIVYLLARELFHRPSLAVIAAWLIALSPWHIHRSRFATPSAMVPTMVALTMLAVVWAMNRRSSRGVVAGAIVVVLAIASYPTLKLYVPLLLAAAALIYWRTIASLNRSALYQAGAIVILFAGPIFYLSIADPAGRARFDQVSVFNRTDVSAGFLLRQYKGYVSPRLLFQTGNGHPGQTPTPPGHGVEPLSTLPLLVAGLMWLTTIGVRPGAGSDRRAALFLLAALALYPVPGSLTVPARHLGRAAHLIPLLALTGAAGAVAIMDGIRRLLRRNPRMAGRCAMATMVVLGSLLGWELRERYTDYFSSYGSRPRVLDYFQFGLEPAVSFMRAHENEYDELWLDAVEQPYIYVLFFKRWPPSEVHQHLRVRREPPLFNEVESFGRYNFGLPTGLRPAALPVVSSIEDPLGRIAFTIHSGRWGGKRILLVARPDDAPAAADDRGDAASPPR